MADEPLAVPQPPVNPPPSFPLTNPQGAQQPPASQPPAHAPATPQQAGQAAPASPITTKPASGDVAGTVHVLPEDWVSLQQELARHRAEQAARQADIDAKNAEALKEAAKRANAEQMLADYQKAQQIRFDELNQRFQKQEKASKNIRGSGGKSTCEESVSETGEGNFKGCA